MEIKRFVVSPIGENCYVVSEGNIGAIIDCGAFTEKDWMPIRDYLEKNNITIQYALQTHMHFDHVLGLQYVERDCNVRPLCHMADQIVYDNATGMLRSFMGVSIDLNLPKVESYLKDRQQLNLGDKTITVLHTPGHTPGGLCFYIESEAILFSGDTLFQGSVGRTDFPGGSMSQEISSIRNSLLILPDGVVIYPGHGDTSTIGYEKDNNMYL